LCQNEEFISNSKGFPRTGADKEEWVGKIQRFSSFKRRRQYLENVADRAKVTISD